MYILSLIVISKLSADKSLTFFISSFKPFTNQERIRELEKEKAGIDSELDLDKQENTKSIEENNEEEMER